MLADVSDITLGQSPPGSSYNDDGIGMPFFQGKAEFGPLRPEVRKWTTQPAKSSVEGDVLVSVRAPVGPTNLAPCDCAIGRGLAALHPRGGIDARYILYWLRASERALASRGTGTTFGAIPGSVLRSHRIPVPPLAEQRRIVAAIEEQVSRLAAAVEGLGRTRRRLNALRRCIVDATQQGDAPVVALGELLAEAPVFADGDWVETKDQDPDGSVRLIQLADIGDGYFRDRSRKFMSIEAADRLKCTYLEAGDLLIARMPDPLGRACIFPGVSRLAVTAVDVCIVRCPPNVNVRWLMHAINSTSLRRQIDGLQSGSTRKRISRKNLATVLLRLPNREKQATLAAAADAQIGVVETLAVAVSAAVVRTHGLRRALLARAFGGELVPQDPNDEPASALLERIAAERGAALTPPRKQKERTRA